MENSILPKSRIINVRHVEDWREAVKITVKLLIDEGVVKEGFERLVIDNSEKLIPNAIPAFDCPILFNYKPNAALIGFVVAMVTSTVCIIIANVTNMFGVILIPLVITSFFECGAAAVIGEGQGGLRGSIIGTAVAAIVMVITMGISVKVYSSTIQNWMLIFGGNDFSIFGTLAAWLAKLIG